MGKRRGGRGDKTDREIVEVLHLLKGGLTYLTGNNNELANAIATGMTCLSGTLDEISSYIDPSNRTFSCLLWVIPVYSVYTMS